MNKVTITTTIKFTTMIPNSGVFIPFEEDEVHAVLILKISREKLCWKTCV
jgi:hypothetical protein